MASLHLGGGPFFSLMLIKQKIKSKNGPPPEDLMILVQSLMRSCPGTFLRVGGGPKVLVAYIIISLPDPYIGYYLVMVLA